MSPQQTTLEVWSQTSSKHRNTTGWSKNDTKFMAP